MITRCDRSVVQVIHPLCLSAIEIHTIALASTGHLNVTGLCYTCQKYVEFDIVFNGPIASGRPRPVSYPESLKEAKRRGIREAIEAALVAEGNQKAAASKRLRVSRTVLDRWLTELAIGPVPVKRKMPS